jgi:hypothetical protein
MSLINKVTGPGAAAWLCWALALGAVALAFPGPDRSGALMAQPAMLTGTAVLAAALAFNGLRALRRRRFDSVLLHLGCALILGGWLAGRQAVRTATPERPSSGSMALIDGDVSDKLWDGPYLTNFVGRAPFSVRLEHFFVERYERNAQDIEAGRDAPVREYRSRVTISEPGQAPYVENVRVNHPAYVRGYHIYQTSWGESTDMMGRPVTYTVLQFIRDPGLPAVYAGFVVLFAGVLLFAVRVFRLKAPDVREVPS